MRRKDVQEMGPEGKPPADCHGVEGEMENAKDEESEENIVKI